MATALQSKTSRRASMHSDIRSRILKTVKRKKICYMEELLEKCPDCDWDQVVLEVDRLSRAGTVCLLYQNNGDFAVSLPAA